MMRGLESATRGDTMRLHAGFQDARRAVFALGLGLCLLGGAAGCSTPKFVYVIDCTMTVPTEQDDPPGVWFDAERRTPARPVPIPVRGVHLSLFQLPREDGDGPKEEVLLGASYSGTHGGISLVGYEVLEEDDHFRILVQRKGFKTMERTVTRAQIHNASMTCVLARNYDEELPKDALLDPREDEEAKQRLLEEDRRAREQQQPPPSR